MKNRYQKLTEAIHTPAGLNDRVIFEARRRTAEAELLLPRRPGAVPDLPRRPALLGGLPLRRCSPAPVTQRLHKNFIPS